MPGWNRICCAVDGSEPSQRALRAAAALAKRLEGSLTVLHVHDVPSVALTDVPAVPPASRAALERDRQEARAILEAARAEAEAIAPGRVSAELLHGDPAWEVVKYGADHDCDVIVVGTHGRTGVRRLMMGSVAERILRDATCPVLAVRARRELEAEQPSE
jgi:nucleotide-binding universal stress UspA family protein